MDARLFDINQDEAETAKYVQELFQNKRYGNEDYFDGHIFEVVKETRTLVKQYKYFAESEMQSKLAVFLAYLHDVLEDTQVSKYDIANKYGDYMSTLLQVLTKENGSSYYDYIKGVVLYGINMYGNPIVLLVKLADLNVNIRKSESEKNPNSYERQRLDKYKLARQWILASLNEATSR